MAIKNKSPKISKRKSMFYLYIAFLAVLSVSVLLMPLSIRNAEKNIALTVISGSLFWIGLLGAVAFSVSISDLRQKSKTFAKAYPKKMRPGIISFFQNKPAKFFDIMMAVSLAGFAITSVFIGTTAWPFMFLALLIFSFGMHCMLNGINYKFIYQTKNKESK